MIKDVIEDIRIDSNGIWYDGHIYLTDDERIIWSPASSPLHDIKKKRDNYKTFQTIAKVIDAIFIAISVKVKIPPSPRRKQLDLKGLLNIRMEKNEKLNKKDMSILLIQTMYEDIQFIGKTTAIERLSSNLPSMTAHLESNITSPIYFYKDTVIINQLFEQTPDGDIVEIIRESGGKLNVKGQTEIGNSLISKLSIELSTEISQKDATKRQINDSQRIAYATLFLVSNGQAKDINKFDLRKVPPFLYFDSDFAFHWSDKIEVESKYTLAAETGPLSVELNININNITHKGIFNDIRLLAGTSKCTSNGHLIPFKMYHLKTN